MSEIFTHIEVDPEVAEAEALEDAQAYPEASDVIVRNMEGKIIRVEKAKGGTDKSRHT